MIQRSKRVVRSILRVLVLTILTVGGMFAQGNIEESEAGMIMGVSRAGWAMESVTWDQQMGVVNRWLYTISAHWNYEGGWRLKHNLHSGWVYGWTTGLRTSHFWEGFSYPGVVGYHYGWNRDKKYYDYYGYTVTVNTIDGQPKWFCPCPQNY